MCVRVFAATRISVHKFPESMFIKIRIRRLGRHPTPLVPDALLLTRRRSWDRSTTTNPPTERSRPMKRLLFVAAMLIAAFPLALAQTAQGQSS